jgi:hypothetical protein
MESRIQTSLPQPTYTAAITASTDIEAHFEKQKVSAKNRGEEYVAPKPDKDTIAAIIDTAFWASLRKEEGRSPKISLAFLPPDQTRQPLIFEYPLALTADILTKLAPAVERPGIHLGVWQHDNELYIWGTTQVVPEFCFVLEVVEPGLLVVKHRRVDGFGKYVNVAVLKGDEIKIVDEDSVNMPDCPGMLNSLLGFTNTLTRNNAINLHVQLAVSMRAHGHGGALLVVPSDNDEWRKSIIHPILYPISPAFNTLSLLMNEKVDESKLIAWQERLNDEVALIGGLTAVDGATIINDKHELLAFGAKITRSQGRETVRQIMVTEPIINTPAVIIPPSSDGGTRHFSAAQFVYDQHDSFALVASQDGRFTIFSWSPCDQIVLAHRVDCLLI